MERYVIAGGYPLCGSIEVHGAKNAVLPILGATLLVQGTAILDNVPHLSDVDTMCKILQELGVKIKTEDGSLVLDSRVIHNHAVPECLMSGIRSSIFLMGALLGCCGAVRVSYPGGCSIGPRPIDLHLKGLRALGAEITEDRGYIEAKAARLRGTDVFLDFPSVGATENIMMAAVFAEGVTVIHNAAKEPEVVELQSFLNAAGADIQGAGTDTVVIRGVKKLHDVSFGIIPDRIVAGTLMLAAAITGGELELRNVIPEHLTSLVIKLREMGITVNTAANSVRVSAEQHLRALEAVRTFPYPGFPTDMQAQMMAVLSVANGTSVITETVFEGRFKHVAELQRLGADIEVEGRSAIIRGVKQLTGAVVRATDLRAGAALVLAALRAEGLTVVEDIYHIDRGYQALESMLKQLGARIERVGY